MMKWFVAVFLVLNTGVFLWEKASFSAQQDDNFAPRPDVRPESMDLLSESNATLKASASFQSSIRASVCFRVGPFTNQETLADATGKLDLVQVDYRATTAKSRNIRAYRVFLGPFDTEQRLNNVRQELDRTGIRDHYLIRENESRLLLSLGLFSQQASAQKFVESMQDKKLEATTRQEMRSLGERHWIEIDGSQQNAETIEKLKRLQWDEQRAKLREVPCA